MRHGCCDLVLINPASRKRVYQSLGETMAAIEPPVWAGLMASFVRRLGYRVIIIDAEAEGLSAQEAAERAADHAPRLVAIVAYGHQPSASTQVMPAVGAVCKAMKDHRPMLPVILTGGHVAALPEQTLREEAADFVAGGEGLYTLVELLEALSQPAANLATIRGLYYRCGKEIHCGPPAPLVQDLDDAIPGMPWDMLPMDRYRAHNWHCLGGLDRTPYAAIYTTLGCPYKCSFCCIQAPFKTGEQALGLKGNSYRYWSPHKVADELSLLANEYGVRNVKVADEMFVLNRKHVTQICTEIGRRGLDLNLWAYARVDTVKEGMCGPLRDAGFSWLALGIETANSNVRDDVHKSFDQDELYTTLSRIRQAGMYTIGNYIFGLPDDTQASMQATLDLALDLRCEFANFYCAMAYPGSPLYEQAQQAGWQLPQSWAGYSQHAVDTYPLRTRQLTASEVLSFRDQAFMRYYQDASYLNHVETTFGEHVRKEIAAMTSHKLVRQYA